MTKRFDRDGNRRFHTQTLCAISHLPPEASLDRFSYDQLFMAIEDLRLGYEAMEQMFRRMVFNVYADESDDHTNRQLKLASVPTFKHRDTEAQRFAWI